MAHYLDSRSGETVGMSMKMIFSQAWVPRRNSRRDEVLNCLRRSSISQKEEELLKASFWEMGQDIRLREDLRFR